MSVRLKKYENKIQEEMNMKRTVEVDMKKVGSFATLGTLGGAAYGAKFGSHVGIVFGRKFGVKGTVVFGTLGGLTGCISGAIVGTVASATCKA